MAPSGIFALRDPARRSTARIAGLSLFPPSSPTIFPSGNRVYRNRTHVIKLLFIHPSAAAWHCASDPHELPRHPLAVRPRPGRLRALPRPPPPGAAAVAAASSAAPACCCIACCLLLHLHLVPHHVLAQHAGKDRRPPETPACAPASAPGRCPSDATLTGIPASSTLFSNSGSSVSCLRISLKMRGPSADRRCFPPHLEMIGARLSS